MPRDRELTVELPLPREDAVGREEALPVAFALAFAAALALMPAGFLAEDMLDQVVHLMHSKFTQSILAQLSPVSELTKLRFVEVVFGGLRKVM